MGYLLDGLNPALLYASIADLVALPCRAKSLYRPYGRTLEPCSGVTPYRIPS